MSKTRDITYYLLEEPHLVEAPDQPGKYRPCAACGEVLPIAGFMGYSETDVCVVSDPAPTLLPTPHNFLLVGETRVNHRWALFCAPCYERQRDYALSTGAVPIEAAP